MRLKSSAASVIAGVAVMGILGAGIANAAPAKSGVPSDNLQLCGAVYYDDLPPPPPPPPTTPEWPWVPIGPPPAGAEGAPGIEVTGTLFNKGNTPVATYSTSTGNDGSFCIQGTTALMSYVLDSGYVVLENDVAGSTENKWETTGIFEGNFFDHLYFSWLTPWITTSAHQFYMVAPR